MNDSNEKMNESVNVNASENNMKNINSTSNRSENINENITENEKKVLNRKKAIIYMIVLTLILILIACFFVHNIIDRGGRKSRDIDGVPANNIYYPPYNYDGGTGNTVPTNITPEVPVIDYSARIKVKQRGQVDFDDLQGLDMFNNAYFDNQAIIAPGVDGTYNFTVENDSEADFMYNIDFIEQNNYNVNMVYKIKRNGQYILGDKDNWITHSDYGWKNFKINAGTIDLYTVEWKWEDADNDTQVGETPGADYKMKIQVDAEQIIK